MDDVAICEHEPIRREDEARSIPGVIPADVDIDDGWANALRSCDDGLRVSVEKIVASLRADQFQ